MFGKHGDPSRIVHAATSRAPATTRAAALALGLLLLPPVSNAIDTITNAVTPLVPASVGHLRFISPAQGQPAALTKSQSDALNTYNNAVNEFQVDLEPAARADQFASSSCRTCRDKRSILPATT